ncbi:MAG TPA: carbon-nitrogen hydrolase family protein [Myxococcales bacterium]|nr:carbon-nitrogen hydrolase family protein [Myxococcales bacterium]
MAKIALVQEAPAWLDRAATLARCGELVARAAGEGAKLVVFAESFVSGYPDWIWRLRPWPDQKIISELHQRLVDSAVDLSRGDLQPLQEAAKTHGVAVVCGINELHRTHGSLYNTVVTIGADGSLLNSHRKLVPTNPERTVYAQGDGAGLTVVETPAGRTGALVCWENYMPLARAALYAQGIDLYVAPTWDHGEGWLTSMQHIAREARCWVAAPAICLQAKDMPQWLPGRAQLYPDPEEWVHPGESVVVDPMGKIAAGPLRRERGILYAECDLARVQQARRTLDVGGHYARPDVFDLKIRTF